ncbi:DUF4126 domain-containing protein [Ruania halotolerans]|uniref:DUF4126 domain-containing protein n=1 Tax=Ruania halotolerans TaxID=2897773 RepID=UPI001E4BD1E4|nr:DUF4126 domain-containing protein [Ruania halotolerans]UFU08232.1 DUF4126 domain-containing protein [Ruania halotolerans]
MELLTGGGLALSAGLNAYIPMMVMGLLARYTSLVELPATWGWLANGWVLIVLGVLLAVEVVADKVPAVDHVNDILQTVVRPTSGGIVFAAGSGAITPATTDPGEFFTSAAVVPLACGVILALITHLGKAGARAGINLSTAGIGAPVASTVEDVSAVTLTTLALLLPVLVLVFVVAAVVVIVAMRRRTLRRNRLVT